MAIVTAVRHWSQALLAQWTIVITAIIRFIPPLIVAVLAVVIAWIAGKILERLVVFILEAAKFDELLARGPVNHKALEAAGADGSAARMISILVFWATFFFMGLAPAADVLNLSLARLLIERLIDFVPVVLAALLTLAAAVFIAGLIREAVRSVLATANLPFGRELGWSAYVVIAASGLGLSLRVLRVSTPMLTAVITATAATVGLALALGFGLGAREVLGAIATGRELKNRLTEGDEVTIDRYTGVIERLGLDAVDLRTSDGLVSIPNSLFIQKVVARKTSPPRRAA